MLIIITKKPNKMHELKLHRVITILVKKKNGSQRATQTAVSYLKRTLRKRRKRKGKGRVRLLRYAETIDRRRWK